MFLYVDLYWVGPYMLMKYRRDQYLENSVRPFHRPVPQSIAIYPPTHSIQQELVAVMMLWGFGVFLHFASDSQKFFTLTWRGRGLITAGLFSWVRNPNYLGETLIYLAYCLLCKSRAAWGILAFFVLVTFVPNMMKKDKSLGKYEEFEAYKAKTWVMVPFLY